MLIEGLLWHLSDYLVVIYIPERNHIPPHSPMRDVTRPGVGHGADLGMGQQVSFLAWEGEFPKEKC